MKPRGRDARHDGRAGWHPARRQDRQRHPLAPPRPPRHGALVRRSAGRREPHARALDRVGPLRHPADRARRRPLRHRDADDEVPAARWSRASPGPSRSAGSGPRRNSPGWLRTWPRPAGDYLSGAILTLYGARNHWPARGRPAGSPTRPASPWPRSASRCSQRPRAAHGAAGDARLPRGRPGCPRGDLRGQRGHPVGRRPGRDHPRGRPGAGMAYFVGHWELRGFGKWALFEQGSGELVGRAGLLQPEGWPGLEVGWLVGREHWGRGYAPEAGRASMEWARHRARRGPHHQPDRAGTTIAPPASPRSSG